jgi:transcriptional repressor NrdR
MRCPYCGRDDTQVKDSRPAEEGAAIRRRRSCPGCQSRFTTFERVQLRELTVLKTDGRRVPFDREKLARSIRIALRKRPVDEDRVERIVNGIQRKLETDAESEVTSRQIGEIVMESLRAVDQVAYVRFASVYRNFGERRTSGRSWASWSRADAPGPAGPAKGSVAAMTHPITEHVLRGPSSHASFYLACGAEDAPLIVFVHGWPELSGSWRHQLPCFAALGFRCVAPDMRGYGRSSVPARQEDYAMPAIVGDMLELLDGLGRERAVWVGHDWGSPVVWGLAAHHAGRCHGVASLCVPYIAGVSRRRTSSRSWTGEPTRRRSTPPANGTTCSPTRRIAPPRSPPSRPTPPPPSAPCSAPATPRTAASPPAPRRSGATAAGSAAPAARRTCRATPPCWRPRRRCTATSPPSAAPASPGPAPGT